MDRHKIIHNKFYYKNRLRIILSNLNLHGASILDLGCGEMILYDLVRDQIKSYLGIDQFAFSNSEQFISGNILDKEFLKDHAADFVFVLGVLDHLPFDDKIKLLEICKGKYISSLIISQRNSKSFINSFYPSQSIVVSMEDLFPNDSIVKLYLLKFPFSKMVYDLSSCKSWIRSWCTEIVYIISKGNDPCIE